jgi:4-hydroxy-2-oxoheptanedioate aldolase
VQQLCKHWSHKAEVKSDTSQGNVVFDNGRSLEIKAEAKQLQVVVAVGPRDDLEQWKDVVEKHLKRFAFREEFELHWAD